MSSNWNQRLGVWYIAEDHPDALAIASSPEGTFTYAQLADSAHQLVHTFRALGVPPSGIVGVISPNGVLPIQVSMACQEAGWFLLLVNAYLTPEELTTMLEHAGASLLVVHEAHKSALEGTFGERVKAATKVVGVGDVPGVPNLADLTKDQPTTLPADRAEGGMLAYSSGTTGKPKGISRPGSGTDPSEASNKAAVFGRAFDFRPFHGPHLVSTGMYHGGSHSYYMGALNVGHALVIMRKFDAEGALALIDEFKVRSAYMVPTQFHRMLQLPDDVRAKYDTSSLHSVVHSAAPCPRPMKQRMFDWWGPVIWETYGGMEGAATVAKPHRWLEKPGTVGRAVKGVRLAILDDDGNELGPNQTGHIYYETDAGFRYHKDDELTKSTYKGKRFSIGDIGYVDDDGYLFIQDRAKDMIISGGVNIFPAEIEGVLLNHPAVFDAGVIGIPDADWGESVLALVELREGIEPTDALNADLMQHCADHLAAYKRPRRVEFRTDLPRTEAGKLYKRQIRAEYWKDQDRQV
ncbi:MAG: AMP-binding protein [Actinomycetota bacterium]|nr:AMP-binding protein [Actinomycetota bacterium]